MDCNSDMNAFGCDSEDVVRQYNTKYMRLNSIENGIFRTAKLGNFLDIMRSQLFEHLNIVCLEVTRYIVCNCTRNCREFSMRFNTPKHSKQYYGMDIHYNHMIISIFRKIETNVLEDTLTAQFPQLSGCQMVLQQDDKILHCSDH